jgi:hypothetical protein
MAFSPGEFRDADCSPREYNAFVSDVGRFERVVQLLPTDGRTISNYIVASGPERRSASIQRFASGRWGQYQNMKNAVNLINAHDWYDAASGLEVRLCWGSAKRFARWSCSTSS